MFYMKNVRRWFSFSQIQKQTENTTEPQKKYIYAEQKFNLINQKDFIKKIEQLERQQIVRKKALNNWKFPLLLFGSTLFIYHLWQVMPYNLIFRHVTISEYIIRNKYVHPIFLAPLSFQTLENLLTYGPLLVYSIFVCGQFLNHRHIIFLYFSNALISSVFTYVYEKYKNEKMSISMISPKCLGPTTPLAFMSTFFAIAPMYNIFNKKKILPFYVIPLLFYLNELKAVYQGEQSELCRESHLVSIIYGLLFGLIFKKLF